MATKRLTAEELVRTYPGVLMRQRELIHSILQGGVGALSHYGTGPQQYADFVVNTANRIIEKTEQ